MNFATLNLDLQSVVKRTYANLYYNSTFMNFLDQSYMQVARQTGTPIIEVIKQVASAITKRAQSEILTPISTPLATYGSVKVDLTQLPLDYGFKISPVMLGTNVAGALDGQIKLKDSEVAFEIDKFGYDKFNTAITGSADGAMAYTVGQCVVWAPADATAYITLLNNLKAKLFNRKIYGGYMLGLIATEYANFVTSLTSFLKYETRTGVEGVDKGIVGVAYGIDTFEIQDSAVLTNGTTATGIKGFFANAIGAVGDMFFSSMAQYPGNYQGYPGYYVLEGNILFGAEVVRSEAIIKLVGTLPTITQPTLADGQVGVAYSDTNASTGVTVWSALGLPAGLVISASTGAITGTPTTAGTYVITVLGKDVYGNYADSKTDTVVIAPASS